jgi:hypothetical protein
MPCKYFILNDIDRPDKRHVAYKRPDGRFNYLDRSLWQFDGMIATHPTPIEDFGFNVVEVPPVVSFVKFHKGGAQYQDGTTRDWQGDEDFFHKYPKDI